MTALRRTRGRVKVLQRRRLANGNKLSPAGRSAREWVWAAEFQSAKVLRAWCRNVGELANMSK